MPRSRFTAGFFLLLGALFASLAPAQTMESLGSWQSLSPSANATWVIVHHRDRIYIGHEADAAPNRAVYFDPATQQFGRDTLPDGSPVLLDSEQIHKGLVRQGDLVWAGEDGAIAHNGAWLHIKRHDGWRGYAIAGSNAHSQSQYVYDGKIFASDYLGSKPGVTISYDAGASFQTVDLRSSAPGADFPVISSNGNPVGGFQVYNFFEFRGSLFGIVFRTLPPVFGDPNPTNEAFLVRYTGDALIPWERTYKNLFEMGLPGKALDPESIWSFQRPTIMEFKGYLFAHFLDFVSFADPSLNNYRLVRYGAETVTGDHGTYQRPANGIRVSDDSLLSLVKRHGYLYRIDRAGGILRLLRTADGDAWTEIFSVPVGPDSAFPALATNRHIAVEIAGPDVYLGAGTSLYRIPAAALGAFAPSGAANTAPVAHPDAYVANSQGRLEINEAMQGPLANDTDADEDPFYASLVTSPAHGTLTFRYNGTFTYVADAGYTGTDSFLYRIEDRPHTSAPTTVTISIPQNTPETRVIVRPTSVTATRISTGATNTHDANTQPINLINGNGLSAPLDTGAPVPGTPSTVTASGIIGNIWLSADTPLNDHRITLDLGATYSISGLALWNNSDTGPILRRAIRTAKVGVSADNITFTPAGTLTFEKGAGGAVPLQIANLSGTHSARYVRFEPTQNYAAYENDGSGDTRVAFNEIRLLSPPAEAPTPPLPPANLTATATGPTSIALAWADNSTNETGFLLERSLDGVSYHPLTTTDANVVTVSDTGLSPVTTYHYRVRATGAAGQSAAGAPASATTSAAPPPTPQKFVVRPASITATRISTGAANFHDGNTAAANLINGSGLATALNTAAAVPATPTTVTASGTGASQALWLSGDFPLDDHRLTLDLGATYLLTDLLLWNQTEPGVVTRRSVRTATIAVSTDNLSYTSLGSYTFAQGDTSATIMQTAAFPAPVSARYVRFDPTQNYAAFNNDGSGDRRHSLNELRLVARPPLVIPAAPSGLVATAAGAARIDLTWIDNAADESGFLLERAIGGGAFASLASLPANTTAYADQPLQADTTHHYRVRALGPDGDSAFTPTASARTSLNFALWSGALPLGQREPTDQPHGDGVPNLLRYAFAFDPAAPLDPAAREHLPHLAPDPDAAPGALRFTFSLPVSPYSDIRYAIQRSATLATDSWEDIASKEGSAAWSGSTSVTEVGSSGRISTSVAVPAPAPRAFYRLSLTLLE